MKTTSVATPLTFIVFPAFGAGTPLPRIQNSPDTHCDYQRQCTDSEFVEVVDTLKRQWNLMPEWLRAKCAGNSTYPAVERCILSETVPWLNDHPDAQAPWIKPENFVKPTKARPRGAQEPPAAGQRETRRVIARGVSVVPGAIVCRDHATVMYLFHRYTSHWEDSFRDAITQGQSRLLRESSSEPNPALYGCALVAPGTAMMMEVGNVVPVVSVKLPSGKTIRGVTDPSMVSQ